MRRTILLGVVGLLAIAGVFLGVVGLLNATVFSASGFVRGYLDALARHDAVSAREYVGVELLPEHSDELLTRAGMPGLDDIELVSDVAMPDGSHSVEFSWRSQGTPGSTEFTVSPRAATFGLFSAWSLDDGGLAWLSLTVQHDDRFTVNGLDLVTAAQNAPALYLAFAPGVYVVGHDTALLAADPVTVVADEPGRPDQPLEAALDIQPTEAFVAAAQAEVDAALDDCATQEVLMPTGCPFGQSMANRIASTPEWSIVSYPEVAIVPGLQASQWEIPATDGVAHLRVDVRSLFDGTVTPFDNDIPYRVGFVLTLGRDDTISLSPQYASG